MLGCLLAFFLGRSAAAQPFTQPTTAPAGELIISLLTMQPGDAAYERFGHNAILVEDRLRGAATLYNYGVFDFFEKGFYSRFILGRMRYRVEAIEGEKVISQWLYSEYTQLNRTVWVQELNLTAQQKHTLGEFLTWNARPENRDYSYDYYTDNCSTRVRDALDQAVSGQMRQQLQSVQTGHTYRWHTRRLMQYDLWLYTALNAILAQPVDRPLTAWQESFLPVCLQQHVRNVTVLDTTGQMVPLVKREAFLWHTSARPPDPAAPPFWIGWFLLAGIGIAFLFVSAARMSPRFRPARLLLATLGFIWVLILSGCGAFGLWAWLGTEHVAVYRNENLLQVSPIALPLIILLPAALLGRQWASRLAWWVALAVLASNVGGLLLKLLPAFYQVNGEIIALTLPANIGMVTALCLCSRPRGGFACKPEEAPIRTGNKAQRKPRPSAA